MRLLTALLLLSLTVTLHIHAQPQNQSGNGDQEPTVTSYTLAPDKLEKAEALYTTANTLFAVKLVWGIVVLTGFLRWKIGPRFREWAIALTRYRFIQAYVVASLLLLSTALLDLPLRIYGHSLSLRYGLSVERWGTWFADWGKEQLVFCAAAGFVAWLLFLVIRWSPTRAWVYFWMTSLVLTMFTVFIAPVVLDPMFNKFEPLIKTQPALVEQIERVTKRGGLEIPPSRMYEMKASEKYTTYNAYVTGFGPTKRVVVWDNTSRDLTTAETLFVFGHEMGHYVLHHIWKGMIFSAVLTFFLFYLAYSIISHAVERWGDRLGIGGLDDLGSLPLILLVASILSFFAMPAISGYSRHIEHEADIYGLEVTQGLVADSTKAAAASFQKLGEKSLDYPYPNPLLVFWTYDHPDIASRTRFALQYRPWDTGQPNRFVK